MDDFLTCFLLTRIAHCQERYSEGYAGHIFKTYLAVLIDYEAQWNLLLSAFDS